MTLSSAQERQSIAARLEVIQLQMWRLEKAMRDVQTDLEGVLDDVTGIAENPSRGSTVVLPPPSFPSTEADFAAPIDRAQEGGFEGSSEILHNNAFEEAFSAAVTELFDTTRPPILCASHDAAADVVTEGTAQPINATERAQAPKNHLNDVETEPVATEPSRY